VFKKILIANRGEIALRVICACREMGIKTVAVFSEADEHSLHVRFADEAVCIGPARSRESYLHVPAFNSAAEITGAETDRPEDGPALWSGNSYLSPGERLEAPALYQGLNFVANEIRGGHLDIFSVEREAMAQLSARGWKPDYISVRKRIDLQPPSAGDLAQGAPLPTRLTLTRVARLLQKDIPLGQLADLHVGDVIPISLGTTDVLIDDSRLFTATVAEHQGKLCLTSFADVD